MNWRVPLSAAPQPIDGADLLWSLIRSVEHLAPLFANPLRPATPASPASAGEEGDHVRRSGPREPSHA